MMRPYVAGDDVRRIDWNATARTGEPRARRPGRARSRAWLVLDTSVSMQFEQRIDARRTWPGVAVAIGHLATPRQPARRRRLRRPRGACHSAETGRVGLVGLLAALRSESPSTARARARSRWLSRTGALARQRSLVVVSDFRGPREWRRPLLELAGHHDVIAVEIRDPRAGARGRRPPVPRRPRDRTAAAGRHAAGDFVSGSRWRPWPSAASSQRSLSSVGVRTSFSRPPATGSVRS